MNGLQLFGHQLRFDQKLFWRNPATVFFSVMLPLVFLFLLGAVFGGDGGRDKTYDLLADEYLVPAIMTLGIVSATFVNMSMTITFQREMGLLKRMRGTPLPTWAFVAARTASATVNALVIAIVIMIAGLIAYGVDITSTRLAAVLVASIVGGVSFCALGFALTTVIPNQSAATPITNLIVLPLYFISGVFGNPADLPQSLRTIGKLFPIEHLGACLFTAYGPHASGLGIPAKDLWVVAIWGVAGLIFAARRFIWEPRGAH